jgi:hypothetical protein
LMKANYHAFFEIFAHRAGFKATDIFFADFSTSDAKPRTLTKEVGVCFVLVARQANSNVLAKTLHVFTKESFGKLYDFCVGGKRENRRCKLTACFKYTSRAKA